MTGCLWIEGKPGTRICGAEKSPGRPYCLDHCVRAYYSHRTRTGTYIPFPRDHFLKPPGTLGWRKVDRMAGGF